jgi:WD40 repeat protein
MAGGGGVILLWEVESGRQVARLEVEFNGQIALAPDETRIAIRIGWERICLYGLPHLNEIGAFAGSYSESLFFLANGTSLVTGNAETIKVWDVRSGKVLMTIDDSRDATVGTVSQDETRLVTGTLSGDVDIWTLGGEHLQRLRNAHADKVWAIAFSRNGEWCATGAVDGGVNLWNAGNFELVRNKPKRRHPDCMFALAFSPDGKRLAIACDTGIKVWDTANFNELGSMEVAGGATAVVFSAAGDVLAGGGMAGEITLWRNQF